MNEQNLRQLEMQRLELLLTAKEPISHHDPTTGGDGNTLTFLRIPKIIDVAFADTPVLQPQIDTLVNQNPFPESLADLFQRLDLVEFIGTAYVKLFIEVYGSGSGSGLFKDMQRYEMLDKRLEVAAIKAGTLRSLWSTLCNDLKTAQHPAQYDAKLMAFFAVPPSLQFRVLAWLSKEHRQAVTVARLWNSLLKQQDEQYCISSGAARFKPATMFDDGNLVIFNAESAYEFVREPLLTAFYPVADMADAPATIAVNLPTISTNSLRHQIFRTPARLQLFGALGLEFGFAGDAELEQATALLFENGGNIKAGTQMPELPEAAQKHLRALFGNGGYLSKGAKQNANGFALSVDIRRMFPSLDLLGGVVNAFDLGESRLQLSGWLVCRENYDVLPESVRALPNAQMSCFEMLTEITRTRQAFEGEGQMIYNYEALVAGAQIYVEVLLTPGTSALTAGCAMAALEYYAQNANVVGGQVARGHGHVAVEFLSGYTAELATLYREYLAANAATLKAALLDGSLGTGVPNIIS